MVKSVTFPRYFQGWGRLSGGGNSPDILQEARVPVVSNTQCDIFTTPVTGNMICTSFGEGTSTCNGDSGGPLVCLSTQNNWVSYILY